MAQELKAYGMDDPEVGEEYEMYKVSEVDSVLAEKDATIGELKAKLENVNELVKAANKFVDDLKNTDCSKKDDEIKRLKKSVQFFSDLHHNESESAKECFRRLMDLGLIDGWGLTEKFFVMPKYTKERLAQFEKQDAEIRRLKRALWLARAERAKDRATTCNDFAYLGDTERDINMTLARTWMKCRILKPSEWSKVWNNVERKCRAKAEEYK